MMQAGRELDALVAEKVMGWTQCTNHGNCSYWFDADKNGHNDEEFSVSIESAWQVVEKMPVFTLRRQAKNAWNVHAKNCGDYTDHVIDDGKGYRCGCVFVTAETAPLAICLAALKAMGVEMDA